MRPSAPIERLSTVNRTLSREATTYMLMTMEFSGAEADWVKLAFPSRQGVDEVEGDMVSHQVSDTQHTSEAAL
jgi:hypothetical protein